ncbi:hypothetical protein D3C71_1646400 [compost metagenome]
MRRGEVAVLPLEIQQRLRGSSCLQVQRFDFANHDQVVPGGMFGVNFAIKPMQAAGNDRVAQRRCLPFDALPLVGAAPGKLVGNADLFT